MADGAALSLPSVKRKEPFMENKVFDIVLLMALPASGKSEVRNFMANISPERLASEFHIGENLQRMTSPTYT